MVTASKPTVRTNNPAQMRAVREAHKYTSRPVLGQPAQRIVLNHENRKEYKVDLDAATCTCKHFQERLEGTGQACKHMEYVSISLQVAQSRPQPEPVPAKRGKRWEEMNREERITAMFGPDC